VEQWGVTSGWHGTTGARGRTLKNYLALLLSCSIHPDSRVTQRIGLLVHFFATCGRGWKRNRRHSLKVAPQQFEVILDSDIPCNLDIR